MNDPMNPASVGEAYDMGLTDGTLITAAVADEYARLQDEVARLRYQLEQVGLQEWVRQVDAIDGAGAGIEKANAAVRRAESVAGFWMLVALIMGVALIGALVRIFGWS